MMTSKSSRHVVNLMKHINLLGASRLKRSVLTSPRVNRQIQFLDSETTFACSRKFQTWSPGESTHVGTKKEKKPGSEAFVGCETAAIADLFFHFSGKSPENGGMDDEGSYLSLNGVKELLNSIGEKPDAKTLERIFVEADANKNGKIHLQVSK